MGQELRTIKLSELSRDARTQSRAGLDQDHVQRLFEAYAHGPTIEQMPPIQVVYDPKAKLLVCWDGHHRIAGAAKAGLRELPAEVTEGTVRQAIELAAGANRTHGLPRSRADNRRAVEILLGEACWAKRSDRWIAERVGISHPTVAKIREELADRRPAEPQRDQVDEASSEQVVNLPPAPAPAPKPEKREGKDGKAYASRATMEVDAAYGEIIKALGTRRYDIDGPSLRRLMRLWHTDPELAITAAEMLARGEVNSVEEALRSEDEVEEEDAEDAVTESKAVDADPKDASGVLRDLLERTRRVWVQQCQEQATPTLGAAVLESVAEQWLLRQWKGKSCT